MYGKPSPLRGRARSSESIEKQRKSMSGPNGPNCGKARSAETKKRIKEALVGKKRSPESIAKQKEHMSDQSGPKNHMYGRTGSNNPNYGKPAWNRGIPHSAATMEKLVPKLLLTLKRLGKNSFNKSERRLDAILKDILPGEYKFVGDGEVIIAGKCPDFINVNGKKKIIEFNCEYWHKDHLKDARRAKLFKRYGYQTLFIWDRELKATDVLKTRILEFNKS
jgi:very-short-patch-repair endonuclease